MITADEIFARLEESFVLTPAHEPRGSDPAELFLVRGTDAPDASRALDQLAATVVAVVASDPDGQRHALRVVSGGWGNDAPRLLLWRKVMNFVKRPAHLERPGGLHVLCLKVNLRTQPRRKLIGLDDWRWDHDGFQHPPRRLNG